MELAQTVENLFLSTSDHSARNAILRRITIISGLAILYYFTAVFGLRFALANRSTTALWAPSGISPAACRLAAIVHLPGTLSLAKASKNHIVEFERGRHFRIFRQRGNRATHQNDYSPERLTDRPQFWPGCDEVRWSSLSRRYVWAKMVSVSTSQSPRRQKPR